MLHLCLEIINGFSGTVIEVQLFKLNRSKPRAFVHFLPQPRFYNCKKCPVTYTYCNFILLKRLQWTESLITKRLSSMLWKTGPNFENFRLLA